MKIFADARIVSGILWGARVMGSLLLLLFIILAAGEGLPDYAELKVEEAFLFLALFTMLAGIITAYKWEAAGAVLLIDGFILFEVVEFIASGYFKFNFILLLFPVTGLMFLFYWWHSYKRKFKQML